MFRKQAVSTHTLYYLQSWRRMMLILVNTT